MAVKYLIFFLFVISAVLFASSKHFLESGIMLGGICILLIAEKNKKAREILKKIF